MKRWMDVVEIDTDMCGLSKDDAIDRKKWRELSWKATGQPLRNKTRYKVAVERRINIGSRKIVIKD